jgi:phage terminase large subunit-like protein
LSTRDDLTAAVFAACDAEGTVHLLPLVFTPMEGINGRAARDRAPYEQWVREGRLIAVGGATVEYEQVAAYLRDFAAEHRIQIDSIQFDRWRIEMFKMASAQVGFAQAAEWKEVGQGFMDFSPRCENFARLLLNNKLRHGSHPLLNLAASSAIAVRDPANNVKLAKNRSSQKIDPLVAAVMAAYPVSEGDLGNRLDVLAMIG